MSLNKVIFSSASCLWETPHELFNRLHAEHQFTLDVCANRTNAKCKEYFSPQKDGLRQSWHGVCWMNPPYGRNVTGLWVQKAFLESLRGIKTVALLPARTDTKWYHEYILNKPNISIEFIKGRLRFGNAKAGAPFPSMIVVFGLNNIVMR